MMSVAETRAVVHEAHRLGRKVTVHLGDEAGAHRALEAGIDEWAHVPSDRVPDRLLAEAARRGIPVISTLDTESHCRGDSPTPRHSRPLAGPFSTGTDMGHLEIPNGFDSEELQQIMAAGLTLDDALAAATSRGNAT